MIERPSGLEAVEVNIEFNFLNYTKLEIDLAHVNKDGRSSYSCEDVAEIVSHLLNGLRLEASDEKAFGEEICSYFVRSGAFEEKNYKLVFCICSDRPESIGVITLH
ncbi:hypothetical protein HBN50_03290 [Halobacteriovorax sp. GB3]|uniref:hypothetical protein n=1 Tax=Halobacteriovorax sp. GB3 TaxID=2719615 RepID=UPI00235FD451|nr:hypothetical protein [Halobacteriovorax sp. GB3]MDD0852101.1 hypothetical protein [Halobacteriovorax sp. GB3]